MMNLLDLFILIPIGYFAFKGYMNGIINEVLSIAGIILAVFITFEYMHSASAMFQPLFSDRDHATIAAGIFLFVITVVTVQLIAYLIQKFFVLIKINFINRLAGIVFGAVKSGIVVSAALLLLAGFNKPAEISRNESFSYPVIIQLAPATFDIIATVYPGAENFIDTIERTIAENNPIKSLPIFEQKNP